jgi:hypothetical protein
MQHDFAGGIGKRLTLFAGQEVRQFTGVGFDGVGHLADEPAAFFDRCRCPSRECGFCRGHHGIELVPGRARALRQYFLGRGIEDRHGEVAGDHLAVDEKLIGTHWLGSPLGYGPFRASLYPVTYHEAGTCAIRLEGHGGHDMVWGI